MVAFNHFNDEELTEQTHTGDTNWVNADTVSDLPRIPAASLKANTKYLIRVNLGLGGSSIAEEFGVRVATADEADIAAKSECVIQPADTGKFYSYFFPHSFETDGIPSNIDIEIKTFVSGETVKVEQITIEALDLDDVGTPNYFETISADPGAATDLYPIGTPTVEFSISGSDLGSTEEWYIYSCQRTEVASTNRNYEVVGFSALDASTSTVHNRDENEGENIAELRMTGFGQRHKASAGTPAFEIRTGREHSSGSFYDRGGYAIALKTSVFKDKASDYVVGPSFFGGSETTIATIASFSPTVDADFWFFGSVCNENGGGPSTHVQMHIENDTVEDRTGDQPLQIGQVYDASVRWTTNLAYQRNILASDTSTWDLRAQNAAGSGDNWVHRWLIFLSMEKAAAAQIIAVGTLAETDSPVAIAAEKPIITAVGVLGETDTPNPIQARKVALVGTVTEDDALVAIQALKPIIEAVGIIGETDTLIPTPPLQPQIVAVGIIGETDIPIPTPPVKVATVGTLDETDALVVIQARKIAQVGTLPETDALVVIQALKPIIKVIGTPTESEAAQVVLPVQGQVIVVGTASEVETAQAVIALKPIIKAIGFASETEIAQAVNGIKTVTVGTPSEIEVAQVAIPFKTVILGTPTETEAAQIVAVVQPGGQTIVVGTPTETEVAQGVALVKSVVVGFASESEAAQAVAALKPIIQAIGTVAEIESAQGVAVIKPIITPIGTATEIETAQIVRYIRVLQIGTATEIEVPITVTVIKIIVKAIGQASESEVAQIIAAGISGLGDDGVLLTADDTGKAKAVVVVSTVAVLYDVVKIRS